MWLITYETYEVSKDFITKGNSYKGSIETKLHPMKWRKLFLEQMKDESPSYEIEVHVVFAIEDGRI